MLLADLHDADEAARSRPTDDRARHSSSEPRPRARSRHFEPAEKATRALCSFAAASEAVRPCDSRRTGRNIF